MSIEGGSSIGERLNRMAGLNPEDSKPKVREPGKLDKDAFMKMFMQQLKYQDPFNPMKSEQFGQQMAQFSMLEQQVNTNKHLENMAAAQSSRQLEALQLVGKEIISEKNILQHKKDSATDIKFKLARDANEVGIQVFNKNGDLVRDIKSGKQAEGDISMRWDGFDDQGAPVPAGDYTFKVKATAVDNSPIEVPTRIEGRVTGVSRNGGRIIVFVGDKQLDINDIKTVKEATAPVVSPTVPANAPAVALTPASKTTEEASKVPVETAKSGEDEQKIAKNDSGTEREGTNVEISDDVKNVLSKDEESIAEDDDGRSINPLMPFQLR